LNLINLYVLIFNSKAWTACKKVQFLSIAPRRS